jgi:hypothetical protein
MVQEQQALNDKETSFSKKPHFQEKQNYNYANGWENLGKT